MKNPSPAKRHVVAALLVAGLLAGGMGSAAPKGGGGGTICVESVCRLETRYIVILGVRIPYQVWVCIPGNCPVLTAS